MSTKRGIPCPTCKGGEETEYVALIPMIDDKGGIIYPHEYAVGLNCYREQFKKVYPEAKMPV